MSSETDALIVLRQAIKKKNAITYTNDSGPVTAFSAATHIVLSPTTTLPKSTPTRLRKPGSNSTDPQANPNDFFPLGAVYLAWLLRDASSAEYMKQVRENGYTVGFVSVTERKAVADWLEDKTQSLPGLIPIEGESRPRDGGSRADDPVFPSFRDIRNSESTTPPGTPPQSRGSAAQPSVTSSAKGADATSSPLKRRYVADPADLEVVKKIKENEIELQDRNTVLRGIKPNFQPSNLYAFYSGSEIASPEGPKPIPDIMISSSPTSLVTMYNVRRFLQDAVFEPSQDARARAVAEGNPRAEDVIPIYRKRTLIDSSGRETESQTRYFVVDSAEALAKFGPDAWDRVVCVMTTGQAWQFRPYKWQDPKTLFHHVKGIYFSWTNDPPNPKIKDWNVTELKIDPNRRHVDKSVVAHFWRILDQWTTTHKPSLMQG
ncbi:hypothetical protein BN946_scf184940.g77 [Trametes cinnabarina]|uniref:Cell division control protein 73 C-terminal domain-containing protein n=1 Tax=Pycnoporus cinnabarinus TaxID=5643 RepID=A0A060SC46_PYCCI|nr:hypothetical protein BN946_scf184940.g77 [Trametes cinnabarina]